jgi:hypothetical protein
MLSIYASALKIATRQNPIGATDAPNNKQNDKWLPEGHWWLRRDSYVNPKAR